MAEAAPIDWRIYRVIALVFLAIKLVLLVVAHPFMDETYYWLWGQHPALSYFDHPPMVGWAAWLGSLLGWNIIGLRFVNLLTLLGDIALLYALARQLRGDNWRDAFWPMAALFLATPLFLALTNVALPDHLLISFSLLTLYAVIRFREGFEAGVPRWRFLYLAAFAIGLATLSKYTGLVLAAGLVLTALIVPRLRPVFRTPHLYLAALLLAAMQTPVLLWNLQHNFASFDFIMGGRAAIGDPIGGLIGFALGFVLVLSPFLLWPLVRLLTSANGHVYAKSVFWLSTLAFIVAAYFTNILIHWNATAYVAVLPFLHPYLRSRLLLAGHVLFGLLIAAFVAVNYAVVPVTALTAQSDQTSAWSYGWDEVAAEIATLSHSTMPSFIAATDYALASPLAFAMADRDVVSLSPRREAFDFWFDAASHKGQTAIIVADRWRPLPEAIRAQFASVTEARILPIERYGRRVNEIAIYIASEYAPSSQ